MVGGNGKHSQQNTSIHKNYFYINTLFAASTSQQSEENLPSSTTQEPKTPSQKSPEEAEDLLVAKSKNPYSIDAILRTPTAAGGATPGGAAMNLPNNSIKRKLLDDDSDDGTEAKSPVKFEKKLKIEDTTEEELNVVKDEDNGD